MGSLDTNDQVEGTYGLTGQIFMRTFYDLIGGFLGSLIIKAALALKRANLPRVK